MATDANLSLLAQATKTATFNATALDLGTGTPRRGLKARVIYTTAKTTSGTASLLFQIDVSADNSTWYSAEFAAADSLLALTSTAQAGEIYIPFETSQRYVRLTGTFTDTGSEAGMTAIVTGDVVLGRNL